MRKSKKNAAFTLVELMIIVAILADVMIIALPAFIRARDLAQNTKFANDLRTAAGAFEMYAAENNRYPDAAAPGTIPTGMTVYLNGMAWSSHTPVGGSWSWEPDKWGARAQVGVAYGGGAPGTPNDVRMADIDTRIDNGALSTGGFRKQDSAHYMQIIE
jgi:type II secretory pathway pseudopilin PulG